MVFCGVFEQQKIYVVLSASFGTQIFYCEAFGVGFEREDVDADGGILFLEEGDRLIFSARKFDPVTPLLRDLHWLRMP